MVLDAQALRSSEVGQGNRSHRKSVVALVAGNQSGGAGYRGRQGKVLTKLSDLQKEGARHTVDASGKVYDAKVLFALPEHDLLMMDVPGLPSPIDLDSLCAGQGGDIIAAVSHGTCQRLRRGVLAQRSLRADDQPYLGIVSDPRWDGEGVIGGVEAGSGAHRSAFRPGMCEAQWKACGRDVFHNAPWWAPYGPGNRSCGKWCAKTGRLRGSFSPGQAKSDEVPSETAGHDEFPWATA